MRRVIDDTQFEAARDTFMSAFREIPAADVSKYGYGMYRAEVSEIRTALSKRVPNYMLGQKKPDIGNNNAIEIIYTGDEKEQQVCGLLHLTDDMFGGVICWVTDIDEQRWSERYIIRGIDRNSDYDRRFKPKYAVPWKKEA